MKKFFIIGLLLCTLTLITTGCSDSSNDSGIWVRISNELIIGGAQCQIQINRIDGWLYPRSSEIIDYGDISAWIDIGDGTAMVNDYIDCSIRYSDDGGYSWSSWQTYTLDNISLRNLYDGEHYTGILD